jgi:hypothetical protein
MEFVTDSNPTMSALYLVDRGMQGKYYRWYDADKDQWGACGADMNEAVERKDSTVVGFFPWVGPLTGPKFDTKKPVLEVTDDKPTKVKAAPVKKRMAKAKLVVTQVGNTKVGSIVKASGKVTHPDGTVFFREDRQKWVAMWAGKQEAARPTAEACIAFLKKKYNFDAIVLK